MPNLLFLYTDEQRFDTLACMGNDRIHMPNLNRLADRSTVFERAYCTQPICTPSRGSIVTGLYPHAHDATINNLMMSREAKCLPEYLPEGMYHCAHMGKWHLGDEIFPQHGFTEWVGTEDTYHGTYSPPVQEFGPERSSYHHWLIGRGVRPDKMAEQDSPKWHPAYENRFFRGQIHNLPEEHCKPAFLAERAIEFLQVNRQRPWALFVNFLEPHPPNVSCRDDQYDPADVTLAYNWDQDLGEDQPLRLRLRASGPEQRTEERVREKTAKYWGMNSLIDTHIGRILDALEATGGLDDTVIVLTSDHGDMMGSFGLGGKSNMFDEASRVPLLIHAPGQTAQRRVSCPVSQVDLVATMADMMGHPIPGQTHGTSLRALVEGEATETERDVFIQWATHPIAPLPPDAKADGKGICSDEEAAAAAHERIRTIVTTDSWKMNIHSVGNHELYDLNVDPMERNNVYADPANAERVADLRGRILAWQERVGDDRMELNKEAI